MLGDGQYPNGSLTQYRAAYDPTWGKKKSVTHPTPGDHEYKTAGAGYFKYFEVPTYYSFDIGSWHWVSLNSEIDHGATSMQTRWLEADLAATTHRRAPAAPDPRPPPANRPRRPRQPRCRAF